MALWAGTLTWKAHTETHNGPHEYMLANIVVLLPKRLPFLYRSLTEKIAFMNKYNYFCKQDSFVKFKLRQKRYVKRTVSSLSSSSYSLFVSIFCKEKNYYWFNFKSVFFKYKSVYLKTCSTLLWGWILTDVHELPWKVLSFWNVRVGKK